MTCQPSTKARHRPADTGSMRARLAPSLDLARAHEPAATLRPARGQHYEIRDRPHPFAPSRTVRQGRPTRSRALSGDAGPLSRAPTPPRASLRPNGSVSFRHAPQSRASGLETPQTRGPSGQNGISALGRSSARSRTDASPNVAKIEFDFSLSVLVRYGRAMAGVRDADAPGARDGAWGGGELARRCGGRDRCRRDVTVHLGPGSGALKGLHTFCCLTAQDAPKRSPKLVHTRRFEATRKTGDPDGSEDAARRQPAPVA
jgi:hypothetical protein